MSYQFTKTETTEAKLAAYANLLSSVFLETDKFTPTFLSWQYKENPYGTVVGFDAFSEGEVVAHYVAIPVEYIINGDRKKGLLSLNTVVHPHHQGKRLFTELAARTFEEGKKLGYEFVIGVANQNSTYGFLNKLDFYLIAPLEVKIGIGNKQLDKKAKYIASPHRSSSFYQWRLSNPSAKYVRKGEHLYYPANKYGLHIQLCEWEKFCNLPLKKIIPYKIIMGMGKRKIARGFFLTLPSMLKPSPLNLIFKDLKGNLPVLTPQDILFEAIDFDAY